MPTHLRGLTLADPNYIQPGRINVILGNEHFQDVMPQPGRQSLDGISNRGTISTVAVYLASYPGSLIIAGEEKRAWFQSFTHAPIAPEFWGDTILQ